MNSVKARPAGRVVFPYMLITAHRASPRSHHKAGLLTPVD